MQRSLIRDSPEPHDRTPFLYAFVGVKGVVESSAASKYCAGKLVHAVHVVEMNGREAEAVRENGIKCNVQANVGCRGW